MTLYARVVLTVEISESQDYQPALVRKIVERELSPSTFYHMGSVDVPVGPASVEFGDTEYTAVLIANLDDSNFIEVSYLDESGTNCKNEIPAGDLLYVPHVNGGGVTNLEISADTAVCKCGIVVLV